MVKDNRKGFTLLFDQRVTALMLHCHLTPQGIVDLLSQFKNPRPIFDSSFRPHPWCFAINDWTTKDTEPPLTFAGAEMGFMIWLYNLRVSYPQSEIYIADDDISGAFRLCKCHPNLMSMHSSRYEPRNPQDGDCESEWDLDGHCTAYIDDFLCFGNHLPTVVEGLAMCDLILTSRAR